MKRLIQLLALLFILNGCKKNFLDTHPPSNTSPVDLAIPQDSVKLNPSGYAPLSAIIHYSYSSAGKTKIIVFGKHGANSNIEHMFNDDGLTHAIPVIGLYADYNNTVQIILFDNNNDSIGKSIVHIQTGPLPAALSVSINVDSAHYDNMEPGLNLVSSRINYNPRIPYMIDDYGDIRWLLDYTSHSALKTLSYDVGISRLRNGNFFFGDITTSKIYEVDFFGNILHSWGLSGYIFHHEVMEKPNGNFLVCATSPSSTHPDGTPTIKDYVLEIDRQTGGIINTWDLKESLNEYRTTLTTDSKDWIHINALYYDSTDNTILVSGRTQGVVKLDYNNRVKWILGPHKGWGTNRRGEQLNQFLLKPLDANGNMITDTAVIDGYATASSFEWNWYQHCLIKMPNGNIMMFDNGTSRNYKDSSHYSRAVEYKIDERKMTVQQVWEYGKERGIETYSSIVSSVQYLPQTNHILFCPGYKVENTNGFGGKIIEVDYSTKKLIYQSSISSENKRGFHRSRRLSAYP